MDKEYEMVSLERLKEYLGDSFDWGTGEVTCKDIKDALRNNLTSIFEQYEVPSLLDPQKAMKSKEWHIRRILHFVRNPASMDPILLDNKCFHGMITAIPLIDDGHHRYLASVYMEQKEIKASYCGRSDLLEYLTEQTNEIPF